MRKKRIYLNEEKTKYCIVKLYKTLNEMQTAYAKQCPYDKNHNQVLGVHNAFELFAPINKKEKIDKNLLIGKSTKNFRLLPQSGIVFLSLKNCGAGIVTHELMHAVLWAYKHKINKQQYPIIIKNMKEEELILRYHTLAVMEFYKWYWKIKSKVK